jgi:Family of unknown function (DUF6677)
MTPTNQTRSASAPLVAVAAWVVPGLGHLLLRKWGRALAILVATGGLALTGYHMRGHVFAYRAGDAFGNLGFLADLGAGGLYFFAKLFESAGPDISRAAGDYGTRFIASAGIVNLLGVLDAFEIAAGRRR